MKAQKETDELSQQHLFATSNELYQLMTEIDKSQLSKSKKNPTVISLKNSNKYTKKGSWTKNPHSIYLFRKATIYM